MEFETESEDLPLSIQEVGYGRPIHNEHTDPSAYGFQFEVEEGTMESSGNESSYYSPKDRREIITFTQTAVMEQDSYQNLHPRGPDNSVNDPALDNRFHEVMQGREKQEEKHRSGNRAPQRKTCS